MTVSNFLLVDTETTGLPPCSVVEVAIRAIDPVSLATLWEAESFIKPTMPIAIQATAVHGITEDMVKDSPLLEEFLGQLNIKGDIYFMGHNVAFDEPLVPFAQGVKGRCCTLKWSKALFKSPSYKLQNLKERYGIPDNEAHQAMADVDTTHKYLAGLLNEFGLSLFDMVQLNDISRLALPLATLRTRASANPESDWSAALRIAEHLAGR